MKRDLYAPFSLGTAVCYERFGVVALGAVEAEVSVYVLFDQEGRLTGFKYFDTLDSACVLAAMPDADHVVLYSNHPQVTGRELAPYEDDLRNLDRMPEGTALYLVHEDTCVKA